jgi:hypothetical protein
MSGADLLPSLQPDRAAALEAVVLKVALQRGETIPQQDQVSWMHKTQSPS